VFARSSMVQARTKVPRFARDDTRVWIDACLDPRVFDTTLCFDPRLYLDVRVRALCFSISRQQIGRR
jgi:hypothetical protein